MKPFAFFWSAHFKSLKINQLNKRQITNTDLDFVLHEFADKVKSEKIGESFLGKPIRKLVWGNGSKKVLAWAAMHGNESTSLRGWMDLFVNQENEAVKAYFNAIMADFQIHFIPLLNPDGAEIYTRRNAMGLDMNRDARALATPEMRILFDQFNLLNPILAFNLHDQRNIFTANNLPATISFLAPSIDVERTISPLRTKTMDLISAAAEAIKPVMHGGIGRYTDEFYPTAIGERVQEMGIPTILVECGPSKNDPLREEARMLNPIILHAVLSRLQQNKQPQTAAYLSIPLNQTNQVDYLIKGVSIKMNGQVFTADVAVMEELHCDSGELKALFKISDVGDLKHFIGLHECDYKHSMGEWIPKIGTRADLKMETSTGVLHFENGKLMAGTS